MPSVSHFVSPASFWFPDYLDHSAWIEHAPFAFWLVEALRPQCVVELGTHNGFSFFSFCQAAQRLELQARCFAIDTWKGDEHAGFYGEEVFARVREHCERHYSRFASLVRSTFEEALPHFEARSIDLLHIDGRHFYGDVRHDFESWLPKLSNRGLVLLHDINVRERGFGVFQLWSEVRERYPHFEFLHGHGLGVLATGAAIDGRVRKLLETAADENLCVQIAQAYARLGMGLTDRLGRRQQEAELSAATAETARLKTELAAEQSNSAALRADIAAQLAELTEAQGQVRSLQAQLTEAAEDARAREAQLKVDRASEEARLKTERETEEARLQVELADEKEKSRRYSEQLNEIISSTSWKVTAPIRVLESRFRQDYRKLNWNLKSLPWRVKLPPLPTFGRHFVEAKLISMSGEFDRRWYLKQNPDVAAAGVDPTLHYARFGASEGRDPNPNFDTRWYLLNNPDVPASGLNPFLHYIRHGRREGRDSRKATASRIATENRFRRIVYVSGMPHNPSHTYRVEHQVQVLNDCGMSAGWISVNDLPVLQNSLVFAEIVVLFRVAWNDTIAEAVTKCRRAGVTVLFDIDDLVFDPDIANDQYVDGIRFLSSAERDLYRDGVLRYRETARNADAVIVTTPRLGEVVAALGKPAYLVPNGPDAAMVERSAAALSEKGVPHHGKIRIGYASGTLTHQKDFSVAARAVARILSEIPETVLTIIGRFRLEEFPELLKLRERVELRPAVLHADLPTELARFDVNLAPLELGNPYCEAKSALKYFEAALVAVPTIASPTRPFRDAIQDRENGLLVDGEADWHAALKQTVEDAELRHRLGAAALADVRASLGQKQRDVKTLFEGLLNTRLERLRAAPNAYGQSVLFVLPAMSRGSGGHAKAISIAKGLAERGRSVVLNFLGPSSDYSHPDEIAVEFGLDPSKICAEVSNEVACGANITFATFWSTVFSIEDSPHRTGRRFHFLQDYEPYFYPMGTEYLRAIAALKRDFKKISYGPWIAQVLAKHHGLAAHSIPFYIDKSIYRPPPDDVTRSSHQILFFARPEMTRRCFDLGVEALEKCWSRYGDEFEIVLFGSTRTKQLTLPFPVKDLGVLPPAELAKLYTTGTLGLAFSSTNPSMVPFEMMACGLPVLDIDVEAPECIYGSAENVFLVPPDPVAISEAIHAAMTDHTSRIRVGSNGQSFVEQLPTEKEALEMLCRFIG